MTSFIVVIFLCGQMMFIPTYLAATSACVGRKLSGKEILRYLLVSPLIFYVYGSLLVAIPIWNAGLRMASLIDVYVFLIEILGMQIYIRMVGKKSANKALFVHLTFYLVQMSLYYVFESLPFTLIGNLILPLILNLVIYKLLLPRIRKNYVETSAKKWLISMPLLASIANLFESVVYHFLKNNELLSAGVAEYFSAYNMVLSYIMLALVILFSFSIFDNIEQKSIIEEDWRKLQRADVQTIQTLIKTIEAKDPYTNGHSLRVAEYARKIALRCGWEQERADLLYRNVLLHDVGKIGIPDSILNSSGKLNGVDYELIKKHPEIGAEIVSTISNSDELMDITRHHHERYDGKGYPDGLRAEQLSDSVCIVAVADAYDAMTSRRSYRDVMPQEYAKQEIQRNLGKQFHPYFGRIMLQLIEEDVDYQMKQSEAVSAEAAPARAVGQG